MNTRIAAWAEWNFADDDEDNAEAYGTNASR